MKVTDAMQSILEKQSKTAAQQKTPVSKKTGLSASTMQTDSLTNPYMESVRGSAEGIKADYDDLARDLYISYMDGQTKAKESLGMSGAGDSGLAETSMVRMQNSYQNALRENERARDTAMQNLRTQIGSYGQQGALSTAEMNALYRGIETGDYTVKEEKTPATSFDTAIIPQVHYDTSPTAEKRTTEPDLPANAAKTGADYSLINSGALYICESNGLILNLNCQNIVKGLAGGTFLLKTNRIHVCQAVRHGIHSVLLIYHTCVSSI